MEIPKVEDEKFKPGNEKLIAKEWGVIKDDFEEQFFKKGSVIFKKGDKSEYMVYINSGTVKIYNKDKTKKNELAHILRKGDFYAILALLMNNPYNATGIAATDCSLTLIRREFFDSFVRKYPDIGLKMIKFLAFKLCSTNIEIQLWPKQQFDKFLVVHVEDDFVVQQIVQKLFSGEEFRFKQYTSVGDLRDDLITLVKLARKYQGFFLVSDGELQDGTFCNVFTVLEHIIRLNKSVVSIFTGKVDTSEKAKELVAKFNDTHVIPDIVISKLDSPNAKRINSILKETFYNKFHDAEKDI